MTTDVEFCLKLLRRGPHTTNEILRASFAERGCGLTVHSRIANLRKRGYDVSCRRIENAFGRPSYQYTLREAA